MASPTSDPLRFEDAIAWFRERVPLLRSDFDQLAEDARRRAFTMAYITSTERLERIYGSLLRAVDEGWTLDRWRKRVRGLAPASSPGHIETVFRTNIQSAYSSGRWAQLSHPAVRKARPFWMYDAILDARTTEICRARDGTVLPADDPWWEVNWPPLHYNCRSGVRALTPEQARERGIADAPPADNIPRGGFGYAPNREEWTVSYARGIRSRVSTRGAAPAFIGEPPSWKTYGLPDRLKPRGRARAVEDAVATALGSSPSAVFRDVTGGVAIVDRDWLATIAGSVGAYAAYVGDVVENPGEIWITPVRHGSDSRVTFLARYLRAFRGEAGVVILELVAARGVALEFSQVSNEQLSEHRVGFLRYNDEGGE